jgi:hypothetical protein
MSSEITLLDEMFKVEEVDNARYDRGMARTFPLTASIPYKSNFPLLRFNTHSGSKQRNLPTAERRSNFSEFIVFVTIRWERGERVERYR